VRARVERDDGLLLRSVDYGESDRVLTLLTRESGKLSVLAKGARRSKKRFAGALEPFSLLRVEIAASRGGLARLESATIAQAFPKLLRDLPRMTTAGAMLQLVRELTPDAVADPESFEDVVQLLAALDAAELSERALSVCFQLQQLSRAGFSPRLHACGACGKRPQPGRATDFDARRGYIVCQACGGGAYRLRATTREAWLTAAEADFLAAAALEWTPEDLDLAERALEAFIAHRLERELPRTLRKG
jgi:DNA repair protein RecO (recombination protein O)